MKLLKFFITFIMIAVFSLAGFSDVYAQDPDKKTNNDPISIGNPLTPEFGAGKAQSEAFSQDIVQFTQDRLAGLVATMMLLLAGLAMIPVVVGGFQLIVSQGGQYAEKGKKTLFWGVVGLAIGLTGYVFFGLLIDLIIPS